MYILIFACSILRPRIRLAAYVDDIAVEFIVDKLQ